MRSLNFKKWNIVTGWIIFTIGLLTYVLTLEDTVSFWDCGEYISVAAKLEIGHPPGSPIFQMLGAFFAMFAKDPEHIARMINFISALSSSFTLLLMFWSLTILSKKALEYKFETLNSGKEIIVLGSSAVATLAFCFSDSFWFNATEAEVYAMSSFIMALLFWLALKWDSKMDSPKGHKWLILISYVIGLSFGIHLLSLLVIPAVVFIYINKRYDVFSLFKFIIANLIAILVLAFIFKFLFPMTLSFFSASELFFVNSIGLPFNSGTIIAGLVIIVAFVLGLYYTQKRGKVLLNTLILSVLFVIIGFSSWMMIPIRASANTTINENDPSNAKELLAYYNREQYGDTNVFYDNYYSAYYQREQDSKKPYKDEKPKYDRDYTLGKYVIVNQNYKNSTPNYSNKHKGFIPRMVNPNPNTIKYYKSISGIDQNSKRRPTFTENIRFLIDFQFNYMYLRYLMWNFVGKQNDKQGHYGILNGNWLSGIKFIDQSRLGPQINLPSDIKNNKGRNVYYGIPFILAILGIFYHASRDKKNFYALFLFFIFTGVAVMFYTNNKPFEPRERDYSYVGSFYAFAMWIAFGLLAIFDLLRHKIKKEKALAFSISILGLLSIPTLMAFENWTDHNRSNRYTTLLNAKAYLDSCQENAILFTIGDNDTFPLWYMQEVEGYRTDIKIVNSSLFSTDWYIDQMKKQTYDAKPIPGQLGKNHYKYGTLDIAYHIPNSKFKDSIIDIGLFIKWIESNNPATFVETENGHNVKFYPTNKIRIPVDKETVLNNDIVPLKDAGLIVPYIDIEIDNNGLTKNRIFTLDIIANNNWERPIYFSGGSMDDAEYIWMKEYLQLDGLAYKLVPIHSPNSNSSPLELGRIDTQTLYENVLKWDWRNINDDNLYLDPESRKNAFGFRNSILRLAESFIKENKREKAREMLNLAMEKMPVDKFEQYSLLLGYVDAYYKVGDVEKARELADDLTEKFNEYVSYYTQFEQYQLRSIFDQIETNIIYYGEIVKIIEANDKDKEYIIKKKEQYSSLFELIKNKLN